MRIASQRNVFHLRQLRHRLGNVDKVIIRNSLTEDTLKAASSL
jgi:hypothetical protein